jgi:nonsense-mediated mRNA decay protein 3
MFCVKCGKPAEVGNFCLRCFLQKRELFSIENFRLRVCRCGSYYDRKWQAPRTIAEIIDEQIGKRIKTKNRILKKSIRTRAIGNRVVAEIECRGLILPERVKKAEKKTVEIILKINKCENCSRVAGGYYEALLQIRGRNQEKALNRVKSLSGDIVRIKKTDHGYDVFFMDKKTAKRVAGSLKKTFIIKESFKFITTKGGKRIYRNYYSVR